MGTDTFSVLVLTLWAAISMGTAVPEQPNSHVKKIIDPTNQFSMDLMKTVSRKPGNIILSPLSVSSLLAMLQQGAKENSATQLDQALHLNSEDTINGYQGLIAHLKTHESPKTILKFGNSIFLNQNFDLLPEYRTSMVENFQATVENVDFHQPSRAAHKVNKWVDDTTNGNIKEIIRASAITGRTEMILANTIYFKGKWYVPFNPAKTFKSEFRSSDNQPPLQVNMMRLEQSLRAGEDKTNLKAKWVSLPYDGHDYALIVVLPDDDVDSLIQRMEPSHLKYLAYSESVKEVKLKMPRFKLDTSLSLIPLLASLGVEDIFTQNSNLEGISTTKRPLVVSDVLHKAVIEVNEAGSEAAATSAILVNTLSLPPDYGDLEVNLNKPFLAIILDLSTKLPLFMAKVVNPLRT